MRVASSRRGKADTLRRAPASDASATPPASPKTSAVTRSGRRAVRISARKVYPATPTTRVHTIRAASGGRSAGVLGWWQHHRRDSLVSVADPESRADRLIYVVFNSFFNLLTQDCSR